MASLNGYPLANPHKLGPEWLATEVEEEGIDCNGRQTRRQRKGDAGRYARRRQDSKTHGHTARFIRLACPLIHHPDHLLPNALKSQLSNAKLWQHERTNSCAARSPEPPGPVPKAASPSLVPPFLVLCPRSHHELTSSGHVLELETRYKHRRAHSIYSQASSTAQRSKHVRKCAGCDEQVEYCIARLSEDVCFAIRMVSHVQRATDI